MIEQEIYEHIRDNVASVNGRIYPQIMPQNCEKPAVVYTIVYDGDEQSISGCVPTQETRIQIDIYAGSYLEAISIKDEVKAALYTFAYYPYGLNSMDGFEEDQELSRQIIDFKVRR